MKTFTKTLIGTVATLAVVVGSAAPAMAQERYRHNDRGGIDAGDVLTGALIIGGIAAVAAAADNDRGGHRDRDYRGDDYRGDDSRGDYRGENRGGTYRDRDWDGRGTGWYDYSGGRGYRRGNNPEQAVQRCIRAAENEATRYGGGRADVTRIRDVVRERGGFEVTGRIAVRSDYGRGGRGGWNQGWNGGGRYDNDQYQSTRFYCSYSRGQVVDIDFDGFGRRR
jgi:hypothetical protein